VPNFIKSFDIKSLKQMKTTCWCSIALPQIIRRTKMVFRVPFSAIKLNCSSAISGRSLLLMRFIMMVRRSFTPWLIRLMVLWQSNAPDFFGKDIKTYVRKSSGSSPVSHIWFSPRASNNSIEIWSGPTARPFRIFLIFMPDFVFTDLGSDYIDKNVRWFSSYIVKELFNISFPTTAYFFTVGQHTTIFRTNAPASAASLFSQIEF